MRKIAKLNKKVTKQLCKEIYSEIRDNPEENYLYLIRSVGKNLQLNYYIGVSTRKELINRDISYIGTLNNTDKNLTLVKGTNLIYLEFGENIEESYSEIKGLSLLDFKKGDKVKWWLYTLTVSKVTKDEIYMKDDSGEEKKFDKFYFMKYFVRKIN